MTSAPPIMTSALYRITSLLLKVHVVWLLRQYFIGSGFWQSARGDCLCSTGMEGNGLVTGLVAWSVTGSVAGSVAGLVTGLVASIPSIPVWHRWPRQNVCQFRRRVAAA